MASASRMPVLPEALLDIYRESFSIKPGTVLLAEAEKFVPNLRHIVDENMNSTFVLTTQNTIYAQVLEKAFEGYGNVEVLVTDIYHYEFKNMADTWIRRKIAMINDSGVLAKNSAAKIKRLAKSAGIDIAVEGKKIVLPNDKEQLKIVLGFLDEEAYKGPFSKATFLANSKRRIKK